MQLSNIADHYYLGPDVTLATFGPLLKRNAQNLNATLVALFLNAVPEMLTTSEILGSMASNINRMRPYMPISRDTIKHGNEYNAEKLRFIDAQCMFRNFDELFQRYMRICRFRDIGKAAGLKMSSKHTIVQPWPMQLQKNATQRQFDLLHGSGHSGSERYTEWKSVA